MLSNTHHTPRRRYLEASPQEGGDGALVVRTGTLPGARLEIKAPELVIRQDVGPGLLGVVPVGWRRVGVLYGDANMHRFFVIAPSNAGTSIASGEFYVDGRYRIVEAVSDSQLACEAFEAFEPG
ncbi:MAG: hypothetical protein OEZ06_20430 [Myxococcales bacterium]|nr:hypothetical protein [Myxococcales bacterium]